MAALRDAIALLPRGVAWSKSPDSRLGKLLDALTRELDRVEARAADLLRESNPRTTSELLLEWDAIVALNYPALSGTEPDASLARAMIAWLLASSTLSRESIERFCALSELQVFADGDGVTRPLYRLLSVEHTDVREATLHILADGGANTIVEALFRRKAYATDTLVFDWVAPAIAITSPVDAGTVCDTLVTVSGTSTGVGTVRVTVTQFGGLVDVYETTASGDGTWSVQVSLAPELENEDTVLVARGYTWIVTADSGWVESDDVVVVGEYSVTFSYTAPLTTTDAEPVLTGTATPGASIVLTYSGDDSAPFVADGSGNWTFDMADLNPLVVGTNELSFAVTGPSPCAHTDTVVVEVERTGGGVAPTITSPPSLAWTVAHGTSPALTEGTYTGDAGTWTYDLVRLPSTNVLTGVSKAAVEAYVSDRATDVGPSWKVAGTITNGTGADSADSNTVEYDPSSVASYYADYDPDTGAEVTTGNPAADGDTVQRLLDKAPGARHLTQATAGNRPTYEVGDGPNGHDRIFFTASALTRLEATMSLAQPHTIFTIGRSPFSATNVFFYDGTSTRSGLVKLSSNFSLFSTAQACNLAVPAANTWFLDEAEFNGASSSHRVDAGTPATGNPGTATLSNLRVGAGNFVSIASALDGDIARLVIFSAVLSAADKADVRAYLAHLYGVTV